MRVVTQHTHTYFAVDGTSFTNEKKCTEYEARLHNHLWYCLIKKYTNKQLMEVSCWRLYHLWETSQEKYEVPGFMNAGGYYTSTEQHDNTIAFLRDVELTDAVQFLVERREFSRYRDFRIEKILFAELSATKGT